jgi:hypothetical protein
MARTRKIVAELPPPTRRAVWGEFLKWAVGLPAVCAGGLGVIAGALWLAGGQDLMWRTTADMGTALFWIGTIALLYPVGLFFWVEDLRAGLARAREWDAMSAEERSAALAEAAPPKRGRKRG